MLDIRDICQICLRTDKKLRAIDAKLTEFHDELCDFSVDILAPEYCMECEHLLRRFYNFKNKCCRAIKILRVSKNSITAKDMFYTLLPISSLGVWDERNSKIYEFTYEPEVLSMNTHTHSPKTAVTESKLDHTNQVAVPNNFSTDYEREILLHYISDPNHVKEEANDPLMDETLIKIEDELDLIDEVLDNLDEGLKSEDVSQDSHIDIDTDKVLDDLKGNKLDIYNLKEEIETDNVPNDKSFGNAGYAHTGINLSHNVNNKTNKKTSKINNYDQIAIEHDYCIVDKREVAFKQCYVKSSDIKAEANSGEGVKLNDVFHDSHIVIKTVEALDDLKENKRVVDDIEEQIVTDDISCDAIFDHTDYFDTEINLCDEVYSNANKKVNEINSNDKIAMKHDNCVVDERETPLKQCYVRLSDIKLACDDILKRDCKHDIDTKKQLIKNPKQGKVTKRKRKQQQITNAVKVDINTIAKNCDMMCEENQLKYSKERLKAELILMFASCDELKTKEGAVIDKDCILNIIDEGPRDRIVNDLWHHVYRHDTFTNRALYLMSILEKRYTKKYESVFITEYLNTKEKTIEEFEKRKTYESYVKAKFKCDMCHTGFQHKKRLEYHMRWHDAKTGDIVCSICKVRRKTQRRMFGHERIHSTIYKCKLCPLVTNYRVSMLNHFHQHQGQQYRCEHCDVTYKSQSAYNSHMTNLCKQRNVVCLLCARKFLTEHGLRIHKNIKHQDDPPIDPQLSVQCSLCELAFPTADVLLRHLWISHHTSQTMDGIETSKRSALRLPAEENQKRKMSPTARKVPVFMCRVCNAKGKCHSWLKLHFELEHPTVDMASLYPENIKPHLCDICGKAYKSVYALRDHKYLHTGERPFACDQCPARFTVANNLRIHKQRHAPPTLSCVQCGKMFRSQANLYSHMRTHIGDRRFKCSICGKGFLHRSTLKEHVDGVHSNIVRVEKHAVKSVTRGRRSKIEQSDSD